MNLEYLYREILEQKMQIQFECEDKLLKETMPPQPIYKDAPEWLKQDNDRLTHISKCLPAVDFINSGYVVYQAYEHVIEEKTQNFQKGLFVETQSGRPTARRNNPVMYSKADIDKKEKNIPMGFFSIDTEWRVSTPRGYSCLVMQPFYDFNSQYTLMPSIIDTDKYDYTLRTVGYLNKGVKEVRIMPGDRLLQVIPFKRDKWSSTIEHVKNFKSMIPHYLWGAYASLFSTKKEYK